MRAVVVSNPYRHLSSSVGRCPLDITSMVDDEAVLDQGPDIQEEPAIGTGQEEAI